MTNFSDVLGSLEGGITFNQVNDKLAELVQAVMHNRKAGEVHVSLKVTPNGEKAVSVVATIKAKIPEGARGVTTFYATHDGTLLRRDPNQPELPLREVPETRSQTLRKA